ncbi:MAG: hypothetical protein JWQ38_2129 [Flavipsychrobacter sp.]|nr:hypothetical protein [Flavipsychrobacter sp.]
MKKIFSLFFVAIIPLFLFSSCKKTQHTTKPTPANYRVYSYSEVINGTYPANVYTFSYDARGRVSQIIYTTSDSNVVKYGLGVGTRSVFYYSNDSIYKVNTVLQTGKPIDMDVFIQNTSGQIITAYMPSDTSLYTTKRGVQYEYYGKLLSRVSDKYTHNKASVASSITYTSDNADFLAYNFENKLTATFANSYSPPSKVSWIPIVGSTVTHTTNSYSDVLDNYNLSPITMVVEDNATHKDTVAFPGTTALTASYGVFPDKANRPGDYLWIGSFTTYGVNIYQQAHLTKSISDVKTVTNVTYEIDADSKIMTTNATILNMASIHTTTTTASYRFQYETY